MKNLRDVSSKIKRWVLIINKLISWPVITLIVFICLVNPVKTLILKTEQIKFSDFQITVADFGRSFGVSNIINDINGLTYDELKLFLIVCGEDANYFIFSPEHIPHDQLAIMYKNLEEKGLIEVHDTNISENTSNQKLFKIGFVLKTTEKGEKVHRSILDAIYYKLLQGKIDKD